MWLATNNGREGSSYKSWRSKINGVSVYLHRESSLVLLRGGSNVGIDTGVGVVVEVDVSVSDDIEVKSFFFLTNFFLLSGFGIVSSGIRSADLGSRASIGPASLGSERLNFAILSLEDPHNF